MRVGMRVMGRMRGDDEIQHLEGNGGQEEGEDERQQEAEVLAQQPPGLLQDASRTQPPKVSRVPFHSDQISPITPREGGKERERERETHTNTHQKEKQQQKKKASLLQRKP